MARLAGFEPATYGLEGRCSIRLSYRRKIGKRSRGINIPGFLERCSKKLVITPPAIDSGKRLPKSKLHSKGLGPAHKKNAPARKKAQGAVKTNKTVKPASRKENVQQCRRLRQAGRRRVHQVRKPARSPQDAVLLDVFPTSCRPYRPFLPCRPCRPCRQACRHHPCHLPGARQSCIRW